MWIGCGFFTTRRERLMNAKMACAAALILTLVPACEGKKEKPGPAGTAAGATPAKAKGGVAPTLTAPTKPIKVGQPLLITWTGPNGPDDYIDVVDSGRVQQVGDEISYAKTAVGNPAKLTAPPRPGTYDVRYVQDVGDRIVIGHIPITVVP
jgi:Ca-activated chloride channel family protein